MYYYYYYRSAGVSLCGVTSGSNRDRWTLWHRGCVWVSAGVFWGPGVKRSPHIFDSFEQTARNLPPRTFSGQSFRRETQSGARFFSFFSCFFCFCFFCEWTIRLKGYVCLSAIVLGSFDNLSAIVFLIKWFLGNWTRNPAAKCLKMNQVGIWGFS